MQPQYISIDKIKVADNRIRRDFPADAMTELADSLHRLGQLQPIVVDADYQLIAGERRLRAIQHLVSNPPAQVGLGSATCCAGKVMAVFRDDLIGEQALEAELEENTRRLDLSWQETAAAQAQLHELRLNQKGPWSPSTPEGQRITDTAEEIFGREPTSGDKTAVSDALLLNDFLDDPLVANAPTKREALKVINNLHKAKERKRAADRWDPSKSMHQCHQANSYEFLKACTDPIGFDVAICDPPYGRNMHKHTFETAHEYDDSAEAFGQFCSAMPALLTYHAKPQAHCYVFCDLLNFNALTAAFVVAGWDVWPRPLIWNKGNVGSFGKAAYGPRHCYDAVLFANRGEKETIAMYSDVINVNQEQSLEHPAGKPADLLYDLLRRSVSAGMVALDPMVGGGTFFHACHRAKIRGIGIEADEKYYHMAINNLQECT